jgi:hypothetical protein
MNADQDNIIVPAEARPSIRVHPRSSAAEHLPVPSPRAVSIDVRAATSADLAFLDQLQKQHHKQLGFFPRAQMEGYVENQWVLIAEDAATKQPLGYCASRDRYLKRDELGVIYQLCVAPGHQRGLIGATLIRDVFARSAYGCRLYCCWCAQDLAANYFWESLGFVPIAFRGGSGKKKRVHIFWQRRIREGDVSTPWWFPAKTDQGAMREDRLVLPIPPGKHWSDEMPVLESAEPKACGERGRTMPSAEEAKATRAVRARARLPMDPPPADGPRAIGARQFGGPSSAPPPVPPPQVPVEKPKRERAAKPKVNLDPQLIAKARELRDRYLEHVNSEPHALRAMGKYDVSRLPDPTRDAKPIAMLPAA